MINKCMGLINLNKKGEPTMDKLNYGRPLASTPIGGRYRVIDFTLSNMVNSGITNIGIYSKEKYRSLTDHIGSGKDWDLSRKKVVYQYLVQKIQKIKIDTHIEKEISTIYYVI